MTKPCVLVQVAVRRASRHPMVQRSFRSATLLKRHVARGATLGLVPDAVNDLAFHHAQLDLNEFIHVVQDTATISTMTMVLAAITIATRSIPTD